MIALEYRPIIAVFIGVFLVLFANFVVRKLERKAKYVSSDVERNRILNSDIPYVKITGYSGWGAIVTGILFLLRWLISNTR